MARKISAQYPHASYNFSKLILLRKGLRRVKTHDQRYQDKRYGPQNAESSVHGYDPGK
jgi:hypothetical protein